MVLWVSRTVGQVANGIGSRLKKEHPMELALNESDGKVTRVSLSGKLDVAGEEQSGTSSGIL